MPATLEQPRRTAARARPCQCVEGPLVDLDEGRCVRCGHDPEDQRAILRAHLQREREHMRTAA